jgi:SAM-dependent methyltransferase
VWSLSAAIVGRASAQLWGMLLGAKLRGRWQRRRWERRWNDPVDRVRWLAGGVPREIVAAVENGWFPRGARALDIGCGSGQVAAWLAAQGYPTVGVDLSEAALDHARSRFAKSPGRLEFRAIDICRALPPGDGYGVLVDLRCYHQIPRGDRRAYWRSIARVAAPGARLLLMTPAFRGRRPPGDPAEVRRVAGRIEDGQDGAFVIERVSEVEFDPYPGVDPRQLRAGLAFWMIRRDAATALTAVSAGRLSPPDRAPDRAPRP